MLSQGYHDLNVARVFLKSRILSCWLIGELRVKRRMVRAPTLLARQYTFRATYREAPHDTCEVNATNDKVCVKMPPLLLCLR